jgi:hypothetical protein
LPYIARTGNSRPLPMMCRISYTIMHHCSSPNSISVHLLEVKNLEYLEAAFAAG